MKKFTRTHIIRAHNNRANIENDYILYSTTRMTNGEQEYYQSKKREHNCRMNILLVSSVILFVICGIAIVKWWI